VLDSVDACVNWSECVPVRLVIYIYMLVRRGFECLLVYSGLLVFILVCVTNGTMNCGFPVEIASAG
jgi:hypothetical protein